MMGIHERFPEMVEHKGKAVRRMFEGDDELGYRFLQVEFEDGTTVRASADGYVADLKVEVEE